MPKLLTDHLFGFSKALLPASNFGDLLSVASEEVRERIGYKHVWFMVADHDNSDELRLIDFAGDRREVAWEVAPTLKVKGDAFLEELVASDRPVVIEDARVDPRTDKKIVELLQNRTIINVPLRLLDKPFGIFGMGTFGDEGCRVPTSSDLGYLVGMAGQIAVAAARIRLVEINARSAREKVDLERRVLQLQKLESIGMLAGGIAHDFNNLLTVILSCATLAAERAADPAMKEDTRTIIEAALRAQELTRKLLAMGRQQTLSLKPLDLNGRLTELMDLVRRLLRENIQLDLIKGAHLPLIEGDASQMDQVFMNLCINARDAMPDGGRITVETEQVLINGNYTDTHPWARPGRYVLVTVSDTGVGMSKEVQDRIFDPFFSTKGADKGTGLGLSVAYGVVRQHSGMLHCYSEPGIGTAFKVYLPALERMATAVGSKVTPAVPKGNADLHVLLAEDDAAVRTVAARILEQAGYRVSVAENGDRACELVSREAIDLAVLDVVMPGIPCREIIERIRILRPDARILLSSGYTNSANLAELLRDTGLELVRKPYDPDQLLVGVNRALAPDMDRDRGA